jgi:uncharacterized protein
VVRELAYVQWDPVTVVAPSHVLTFWARVGDFRLSDLESLLWDDKKVFEHWTPQLSIVLTEDYPIYHSLMSRYPSSLSGSWKPHEAKARKFLAENRALRKRMLEELRSGPLQMSQFEDHGRTKRKAEAWVPESDVSEMLFHMCMSGDIMVVGHQGNQNIWGLTEDFLPKWAQRKEITEEEYERRAIQRAIQALGTATAPEINYYYPRGRYRNLKGTLALLLEERVIRRVAVQGFGRRDERYIHEKDFELLEPISKGDWEPRTSLLPPFDNLICSQARTKTVFSFDYVREQFLPKEKRRYGTYVLPILFGENLIGRIDPVFDKKKAKLLINSVYAEPGAPDGKEVSRAIAETIGRLGEFIGAKEVVYSSHVPPAWKSSLR